jgi:hypothetical protein
LQQLEREAMNTINEFNCVALTCDLPEHGLSVIER